MQKQAYKAREYAEIMSYSVSFVHKLITANKIPILRVERSVRIPAWFVEQQIEKTKNPGQG
ncbi:MAG: hypothetical protein AB1500_07720 [Bacillota bacterium]